MSKFDIKSFNYMTCGSTQNTFNIEYGYTDDGMIKDRSQIPAGFFTPHTTTFFGDVGERESMSRKDKTNKASFYDINGKFIIHSLYGLNRLKLKCTSFKNTLTSENVDLYAPTISDDFLGACQAQNYMYCLTREIGKTPVGVNMAFKDESGFDVSYTQPLSNRYLPTFLYPTVTDLTTNNYISTYQLYVLEYPDLSVQRLYNIFQPMVNLSGIMYNYLLEVPEGTFLNRYERGYIGCDMAVMKVPYNNAYNIDVMSEGFDLSGCREYCNINYCGDLIYVTYRDNVNYVGSNKIISYYDNIPDSSDGSAPIQDTAAVEVAKERGEYSYQHVEVIKSLNRWDGGYDVSHKSSMYSLILHDTGLNESTIPDAIKDKLRQNITNNIRTVVDKVCPANTQLFNVYFEGK